MDLQEKRCNLFARPPGLITTLYALSKIMSYCTNIFEEQYLIEAHNKAKWLCWKHKLHIKAIQHHLILLVINRKLYFSGFMLIYLIPPMFFFLDFLCKHFSFLIHCFLQVRARREWILMNLEQAVCSVNPAANRGTTGSPFSLVEVENSIVWFFFLLTSLPFSFVITTMNRKNVELHLFDFLVIQPLLLAYLS